MQNNILDQQGMKEPFEILDDILLTMALINEKMQSEAKVEELEQLVKKHKQLLTSLQNTNWSSNPPEINDEIIKQRSEIINKVLNEEKIAKTLIQAELDRTKSELQRMQSMKKAGHQYQKPTQQEARFVDKTK